MDWYIDVLSNFATFSGRARRKEYWMFTLVNVLVSIGLGIVMTILTSKSNSEFVSTVYNVGTFLPSIAVAARRMHDLNKSGWFMLIPFYNLYLLCQDGDQGSNDYGHDPKGENTPPVHLKAG